MTTDTVSLSTPIPREELPLLGKPPANPASVPNGVTHLFLIVNVMAMIACSGLVIARKYAEYAVGGLCAVVVTQALGYGLIFDINFFLRNLSVLGGLLMVLSDSWVRKTKAFAGLPEIEEKDKKNYVMLAGRVLLIFLFVGFVFSGTWSIGRVLVSGVGLVACIMVAVGFKAKWSATLLVVILSVFNVLVNNFWTVSARKPEITTEEDHSVLTKHSIASRAPPPQGLCQVRLLPDSFNRRRSPPSGQQWPGSTQSRREEEGLLNGSGRGTEKNWGRPAYSVQAKVGSELRMTFCGWQVDGFQLMIHKSKLWISLNAASRFSKAAKNPTRFPRVWKLLVLLSMRVNGHVPMDSLL